jgi:hypothetical protein
MPRQMRGMFFVRPQIVVQGNPEGIPQFGLVAEEVEKVNAVLLNEFLRERRQVQEQEATIKQLKSSAAQQKKGTKILATSLKEQVSQIQDVSDQLERVPTPMMDRRL